MCVRQISEHNVIRVLIKVWKNCSVTMRLEAAHSTYQEGSEMEWSESPKRSRVHQEACGPRGRTGKGMRRMKGAGLPRWQNGKEPAYQCRRHRRCRFDPWVGKIPWRRAWQPSPVFLPGESHGQRWLATVHRVAKIWTRLKQLGTHTWREPVTFGQLQATSRCRGSGEEVSEEGAKLWRA